MVDVYDVGVEEGAPFIVMEWLDGESMQAESRDHAEEDPIGELWATGHSLGGALAELFTLDLALCRPGIRASTITFGCPSDAL